MVLEGIGRMVSFRGLLPVALFGAAFAVSASALSLTFRVSQPMPEMLVLSDKLADWRARASEFDTLFVGTSRTFYHIDPEAVERGATTAGCDGLNVFNFGVFGLTGAEQDWLIEEILAAPGQRLETLILEDPLPAARTMADATNTRARWFHGPDSWQAQLANISSYPESAAKRLFRTGIFGYGALYELSGAGAAASVFFKEDTGIGDGDPMDMSRDGFQVLGSSPTDDILARRREFLASPKEFGDKLAT
jgi:hypothetical protein